MPTTKDERTRNIWNEVNRSREGYYRWAAGVAYSALIKQTKQATDNPVINDDVIENLITIDPVKDAFIKIYTTVGKRFGRAAFRSVQKNQFADDVFIENILGYVELEGAAKIAGITRHTKRIVKTIIQHGVDEGISVQQMGRYIDRNVKPLYRNRGLTIARTEVISASNLAAIEGARMTNLDLNKEWISAIDARTRDEIHSHIALDGQIVSMDEAFTEPLTGEKLLFPGDTSQGASAGNTINCRCTVGFIKK